jgi:hypothetical protein
LGEKIKEAEKLLEECNRECIEIMPNGVRMDLERALNDVRKFKVKANNRMLNDVHFPKDDSVSADEIFYDSYICVEDSNNDLDF